MARTVNANIVTAAGLMDQTACYAVEVGYTTPKRQTNCDVPLWIDSDKYEPADLEVPSLVCSGEPVNSATLSVGHDSGSAADWGRLDLAQDSCGRTVTVYQVWQTAAGQVSHVVFDGVVSGFEATMTRAMITCRRGTGARTRPGNYVVWSDEFPHLPEPGTIIELGGQAAPISTGSTGGGSVVVNPHPGIPWGYWGLLGLESGATAPAPRTGARRVGG